MKEDIEWLRSKIVDYFTIEGNGFDVEGYEILDLINQLDEPEVLSQNWIDEHVDYVDARGGTQEFIHVDDLQNLLVPEQEEQELKKMNEELINDNNLLRNSLDTSVIPQFVAEYILKMKEKGESLGDVFDELRGTVSEVASWVFQPFNDEVFAHAWLNGYEIEQEPKYNVVVKGRSAYGDKNGLFLYKQHGTIYVGDNLDTFNKNKDEDKYQFTEQEIKDCDERYWAFAEPVEELEE